MSDWNRITRVSFFDNLRPEMVAAINKHIELYNLGSILTDILICVATTSVKAKKGLFGKDETIYSGAVLTPRWLVWVVSGEKTSAAVLSARLADITVMDYEQSPFYKMAPDNGVEVNGAFTDVSKVGTSFIGLGKETTADKFKEMLIKAVQDAKK